MDYPGLVYTYGYSIPEWDQKYKLWQTWAQYNNLNVSFPIIIIGYNSVGASDLLQTGDMTAYIILGKLKEENFCSKFLNSEPIP